MSDFARLIFGLAVSALLALRAPAAEEKIDAEKLPKPVADAINNRFPECKITSAAKETENGQVVFDIELSQKNRKFESDIKEDGTILEIEKEVAAKNWPAPLSAAVEAKYAKAKITEVMEVNKVEGKKETPDHLEVNLELADKKNKEVLASLDGKELTEEAPEAPAGEASDKMELDKVPQVIVDNIKSKFPKAQMTAAESGDEDGTPVIEVSIKNENQNIDITFTTDGKILVIEKEIPKDKLPKAVLGVLKAKYSAATIQLAEELVKDDKPAGYEVTVVNPDKKTLELEFDTAGKPVDQEEKK